MDYTRIRLGTVRFGSVLVADLHGAMVIATGLMCGVHALSSRARAPARRNRTGDRRCAEVELHPKSGSAQRRPAGRCRDSDTIVSCVVIAARRCGPTDIRAGNRAIPLQVPLCASALIGPPLR